MRIGVLTGGGDSPGCNAVLYGILKRAQVSSHEVIAFLEGWKGVLDGRTRPLSLEEVKDYFDVGGTLIGTSRTNPFKIDDGPQRCIRNLQENKIDALITIGGDDTNGVGFKLSSLGAKVVGVPQTIDNDLSATEYAVGFDSALNTVAESLDRLRTTARSHKRILVCEIMGRDAGWLCLYGGIAGRADIVLLPEDEVNLDEVCERAKMAYESSQGYALVAVAEGVIPKGMSAQVVQEASVDAFGHVRLGGIGNLLAKEIETKTGIETRVVILGHLQRGGKPTAMERLYGVLLGVKAVELCEKGDFGNLVGIIGGVPTPVPLSAAVSQIRKIPGELLELTKFLK